MKKISIEIKSFFYILFNEYKRTELCALIGPSRKVGGNVHMLLVASRDTKAYFRYDKQRNTRWLQANEHLDPTKALDDIQDKQKGEAEG